MLKPSLFFREAVRQFENLHFSLGKPFDNSKTLTFRQGSHSTTRKALFLPGEAIRILENVHFLLGEAIRILENAHFLFGEAIRQLESPHFSPAKSFDNSKGLLWVRHAFIFVLSVKIYVLRNAIHLFPSQSILRVISYGHFVLFRRVTKRGSNFIRFPIKTSTVLFASLYV